MWRETASLCAQGIHPVADGQKRNQPSHAMQQRRRGGRTLLELAQREYARSTAKRLSFDAVRPHEEARWRYVTERAWLRSDVDAGRIGGCGIGGRSWPGSPPGHVVL